MNGIDAILLVIAIYALYKGYRNGLIVELCGLLGIILGAFAAYLYATNIQKFLSMDGTTGYVVSFVLIMLVTVILLGMLARIVSKILDFTGLGLINKLSGMVVSLLKTALIMSLVVSAFSALNSQMKWVNNETIDSSYGYKPMQELSKKVFPYIDFLKDYYESNVESLNLDVDDKNQSNKDKSSKNQSNTLTKPDTTTLPAPQIAKPHPVKPQNKK